MYAQKRRIRYDVLLIVIIIEVIYSTSIYTTYYLIRNVDIFTIFK